MTPGGDGGLGHHRGQQHVVRFEQRLDPRHHVALGGEQTVEHPVGNESSRPREVAGAELEALGPLRLADQITDSPEHDPEDRPARPEG